MLYAAMEFLVYYLLWITELFSRLCISGLFCSGLTFTCCCLLFYIFEVIIDRTNHFADQASSFPLQKYYFVTIFKYVTVLFEKAKN